MIELRRAGRPRQGHAQVLPVALDREPQLLERRPKHVLDEHDVGAGRHDHAFGGDGAVADVGRVFVQQRHRRHELAQQAERGVDVERDVVLLREFEEPGEPHAGRRVGDQRQRRSGILQPLDGPHVRVTGVAEGRQPADAFAQRELERWNRGQLAAEAEHLHGFVAAAIDDETAFTEAILERQWDGRGRRDECWIHTAA